MVGDCNLPMRNAADIDNAKRTPDCWIGPGFEETAFQKCMEPKVQACPYGADGRTDKDCGVAASEECGKSNNRLPHMMRAIRWPCEFRCAD